MAELGALAIALAALSLVTAALTATLSPAVLLARAGSPVNRLLAAFLWLMSIGSLYHGTNILTPDAVWNLALREIFFGIVFPALGPIYLFFAAHAAPRPATAALRTPTARRLLVGGIVLLWLLVRIVDPASAALVLVWQISLLSAAVFALANAMAHRRATTGVLRRKATTYLLAFGVHDAGFAVGLTLHLIGQLRFGLAAGTDDLFHPLVMAADGIIALGLFGVTLLLAWGLFRSQILDFSFRVHFGVSRGTIAAIFIGLFFVVSELAATLLSDRFGPLLGILAAGLLVFALAPLQRVGDRVASAVVEDPRRVTEMSAIEQEQIFRDQVELALEDGVMTKNELRLIDALRERLNIAHDVAARIQHDALR